MYSIIAGEGRKCNMAERLPWIESSLMVKIKKKPWFLSMPFIKKKKQIFLNLIKLFKNILYIKLSSNHEDFVIKFPDKMPCGC